MTTEFRAALLLAVLVAFPSSPSSAAPPRKPAASAARVDLAETDDLAVPAPPLGAIVGAGADCAFAGRVDPDGAETRRARAQATRLFAPGHPASEGAPAAAGERAAALVTPVGSGDGITGVKARGRIPRVNLIDEEIFGAMDAAKVSSAPLSSDAEFLRRVTLDLTGRIPDAASVTAFLADTRADKRARTIDQLLASDAFVDRWTFYFDELLRNTANADSGRLFSQGRNAFHSYFGDALRGKKPYDVIARELLTGAGVNTVNGAANFRVRNIQMNGPPQDTYDNLASDAARVFLGLNVFCTSCHNGSGHTDSINLYLSTVMRSDFWGLSAYFARTTTRRAGETPADYYYNVGERPAGEYALNTTTGNKTTRDGTWANGATTITPKYLNGAKPLAGESYPAAFARSLTADPQFARAAVNYFWKEMFTLGIVEPADGFDLLRLDPASPPPEPWTIQPTHPALLNRLADAFVASGYDLRALLRLMASSSAYQLSSSYPGEWNDAYTPFFARHFARRLRAEEMLDAITAATAVPISLQVQGYAAPVAWAGQLPDVLEPSGRQGAGTRTFLDTFLRGDRDSQPRSAQGSISQSLVSLNDRTVTDRVKSTAPGSAVNRLIAQNATPQTIVASLYLSTLSRPASATELAQGVALFTGKQAGQTTASVAEDLQFTLLNKLDFLFNY